MALNPQHPRKITTCRRMSRIFWASSKKTLPFAIGRSLQDIKGHILARRTYQQGVAWLIAAKDQNLPSANSEAAREDVRTLHSEMVEAARRLVIVMPTDRKALCDLTMYLETNFTSLPEEVVRSTGRCGTSRSMANTGQRHEAPATITQEAQQSN